jgi:hypothetical protein
VKNKIYIYLIFCVTLFLIQSGQAQEIVAGPLHDWKGIKPIVILDKQEQLHESTGNWQGPNDLSGKIYFTQDSDNIYIAAEVRDSKPLWEPHGTVVQEEWWKVTYDGDALRVKIITSTTTTDLFLFPGAFGINPQIYIHNDTTKKYGKLPEGEIASSYATEFSGYIIESKIPKSALELPAEELTLQFELFGGNGSANSYKSMLSKPIVVQQGK